MGKKATPVPGCVHHWLIAEPNGRTSPGVCKRCGAKKVFYNSSPDWNPSGDIIKSVLGRRGVPKSEKGVLADER